MRLHEAVKSHLVSDVAFQALTNGRVYYLVIPQTTTQSARIPCVVYSRRGVQRQVTYCGTSGLIRTDVALDSYAVTLAAAYDVAAAVKAALIDFSGLLGGGVQVQAASLEAEFDLEDIEPGLYRVSQSWTFWHSEE